MTALRTARERVGTVGLGMLTLAGVIGITLLFYLPFWHATSVRRSGH